MTSFLRRLFAAPVRIVRGWFDQPASARDRPLATRTADAIAQAERQAPALRAVSGALDSASVDEIKRGYRRGGEPLGDGILDFFAAQTFIGHQTCALLAQHWLIDKACRMPARDATRQGFDITTTDGAALDPRIAQLLKRADRQHHLARNLLDFVTMGRMFGVRIVLFRVASTEPDYYEHPFNPDGVTPGSYRGMVQVDPYWCSPELSQVNVTDPDAPGFYEPTYWRINGRRYHRSHLVIFRNGQLPDLLKPVYQYGGVPIPQRIVERVYAAERTANEAPELAMTKRTTVWQTTLPEAAMNWEKFHQRMRDWVETRNNYGVKIGDKEGDDFSQFDTSLADLDAVIMGQYQLVAAAANVPAVKLLGTTPKGFNATGEFEEASYHEELESIQTHDLTPLVERHHLMVLRSAGLRDVLTTVNWEALDSPTAKEYAEIEEINARRDLALTQAGAVDAVDIRDRLRADRNGSYHGIEAATRELPEPTPMEPAGMFDGILLLTNQQYLDPETVAAKREAGDYTVQVTPVMAGEGGMAYRIVLDGHHSLAAAREAGVPPTFVESDPTVGDYSPA